MKNTAIINWYNSKLPKQNVSAILTKTLYPGSLLKLVLT